MINSLLIEYIPIFFDLDEVENKICLIVEMLFRYNF